MPNYQFKAQTSLEGRGRSPPYPHIQISGNLKINITEKSQ